MHDLKTITSEYVCPECGTMRVGPGRCDCGNSTTVLVGGNEMVGRFREIDRAKRMNAFRKATRVLLPFDPTPKTAA